jgi:hypothetical protein
MDTILEPPEQALGAEMRRLLFFTMMSMGLCNWYVTLYIFRCQECD